MGLTGRAAEAAEEEGARADREGTGDVGLAGRVTGATAGRLTTSDASESVRLTLDSFPFPALSTRWRLAVEQGAIRTAFALPRAKIIHARLRALFPIGVSRS